MDGPESQGETGFSCLSFPWELLLQFTLGEAGVADHFFRAIVVLLHV